MDLYELLKFVHISAAIVWLGGAVMFNILVGQIKKSDGTLAMFEFGQRGEVLGKKVFMPSAIVVLLAGIAMVLESGWSFEDLWIVIGIAGIVTTVVIGTAFLTPQAGSIGREVEAKGGQIDGPLQKKIDRFFLVVRIDLVILFLIVLDMVVKPGV